MLPKPEYGVFEKKEKENIILLKQCEKMLKNMGFSNNIRNNLKFNFQSHLSTISQFRVYLG
jgi:hypothetical protein